MAVEFLFPLSRGLSVCFPIWDGTVLFHNNYGMGQCYFIIMGWDISVHSILSHRKHAKTEIYRREWRSSFPAHIAIACLYALPYEMAPLVPLIIIAEN